MNMSAQDWRKLQLPLITLGGAIIFSVLLYSATDARMVKAQEQLAQQQSELDKARQRYQTSGEEKANIIKFMPEYQKLIDRGFVGAEQRVDWIGDLRNISMQYKLFGVSYDIATQEEDYKPKFPLNAGNFKLHRSAMKVSFAMLHENDLQVLLAALPNEINAPFMTRDCIVERIQGGGRGKFLPNLSASCEIDWLTVTEPPGSGGPR